MTISLGSIYQSADTPRPPSPALTYSCTQTSRLLGSKPSLDEQRDVGPPFMAVLDGGHLVDHDPVVAFLLVEAEHPDLIALDAAVLVGVLHRDAADEHSGKSRL